MKPFAFLMKTPEWAKVNNCGQFNGYVAFDANEAFDLGIAYANYDEEGYFEQYGIDGAISIAAPSEITYKAECKLHEIGGIYPISAIPAEATDKALFVIGFDTCHTYNSWDKDTYDSVKSETLKWLKEAIRVMNFYKADAKVTKEEL